MNAVSAPTPPPLGALGWTPSLVFRKSLNAIAASTPAPRGAPEGWIGRFPDRLRSPVARALSCRSLMRASRPETIRAQLLRARASGQVHGAYLFEGPPGAGKHELAVFFTRLLLCKRSGEDGPCGTCHDCRLLAASGEPDRPTHPDLHWV